MTLTSDINTRLNVHFKRTGGRVVDQVLRLVTRKGTPLQVALDNLNKEADRLAALGEPMKKDNPALLNALTQYEDTLIVTQTLISAEASEVQRSTASVAILAVTAKVFLGISSEIVEANRNPVDPSSLAIFRSRLSTAAIPWVMPPAVSFAANEVENFVASAEWTAKMSKWGTGYADLTRGLIVKGINDGLNPREIARIMTKHATSIPYHAAENLLRTLQLTSYREASAAMERINGRYITNKIRIATLDNRTCLACVSLHGTEIPVGERVDDHWRGRCTEYYVMPGGRDRPETMLVDGKQVPFQDGKTWFSSLPTERQRLQNSFLRSPGKFELYKSTGNLSAFVTPHTDPLFGGMYLESTLQDTKTVAPE